MSVHVGTADGMETTSVVVSGKRIRTRVPWLVLLVTAVLGPPSTQLLPGMLSMTSTTSAVLYIVLLSGWTEPSSVYSGYAMKGRQTRWRDWWTSYAR